MPDLSKMNQISGTPMPHIGELVQQVMKQQHYSGAALARQLQVSTTAIIHALRRPSLHAALLWKIGQALNYNFFATLATEFPVATGPSSLEQSLLQELEALRQENEVYKKVVDIIRPQEKK